MAKFGFTSVISADWSALNNAIKEIDSQSQKLNNELRQINSALKLDPGNTVLAAQKLEVMGDAAKEAEKKLEQLRSQQDAMNNALRNGDISADYYRQYQREIEKAEKAVRDFNSESEKSQNALISTESGMQSAAKSTKEWTEVLKGSLASNVVSGIIDSIQEIGNAMIDLAKNATESYGELEQNLGGAEAVFGEYAQNLQKISEGAY